MKRKKSQREPKLTSYEKDIEEGLLRGEFIPVSKEELRKVEQAIKNSRKDAVLNIRINNNVLNIIKSKAEEMGVKYQTFIAEILRRVAYEEK